MKRLIILTLLVLSPAIVFSNEESIEVVFCDKSTESNECVNLVVPKSELDEATDESVHRLKLQMLELLNSDIETV